jgi:hypothetical protein
LKNTKGWGQTGWEKQVFRAFSLPVIVRVLGDAISVTGDAWHELQAGWSTDQDDEIDYMARVKARKAELSGKNRAAVAAY